MCELGSKYTLGEVLQKVTEETRKKKREEEEAAAQQQLDQLYDLFMIEAKKGLSYYESKPDFNLLDETNRKLTKEGIKVTPESYSRSNPSQKYLFSWSKE